MQFNTSIFTNKLKEYRGTRSQNEIAKELGVNRATLSLLENSKQTPTLKMLQDFCNISKIDLNIFFNNKEVEEKQYKIPDSINSNDKDKILKILEGIDCRNPIKDIVYDDNDVLDIELNNFFDSKIIIDKEVPKLKEQFEIKKFVSFLRIDYNQAPIGEDIFDFLEEYTDVCFEFGNFEDNEIDSIIIKDIIILNSAKSLMHQIFNACYSYYYSKEKLIYNEDIEIINLKEQKGRYHRKSFFFACECILPEIALLKELEKFAIKNNIEKTSDFSIEHWSELCFKISVKYGIQPLYLLIRIHQCKHNRAYEMIDSEVFKKIFCKIGRGYKFKNKWIQ